MADRPRDQYERYFTEKLWELLPSLYRHEDGLAINPGVLRALVELMGDQEAVLRRSHDRLWEDMFIDLCDDWAVPYLGDLVGTRMVSALNSRGRRVDVAKTLYYRRRKGTPRVLEELIADITGWEGTIVEEFQRLLRCRHGLDPAPDAPGGKRGRFSGTPQGGWADLRDTRAAALSRGPWDEYSHLPDVRRQRGRDGRFNIPKLGFHLYRLSAFRLEGVTPFARADGLTFTFDPSGREVPLFMPRQRSSDWDEWRTAEPWALPAPLSCRLLAHAEYQLEESLIAELVAGGLLPAAADELRTLRGFRFKHEARLRERLAALPSSAALLAGATYDAILHGAITEDSSKRHLLPEALAVALAPSMTVAPARTVAGNLAGWGATASGKSLIVDPERGRFKLLGGVPAGPVQVTYHTGFPGELGAGPYDRRDFVDETPSLSIPTGGGTITVAQLATEGVSELADSATYGPVDDLPGVKHFTLQAANGQRPYVRLGMDWVIESAPGVEAEVTLEGLWIGAATPAAVVLRGSFKKVTVSHCTLDPGGEDVDGGSLPRVPLFIEGEVDELVVDHSITGPIATQSGGHIDVLRISDSIVSSEAGGASMPALATTLGRVVLRRVTVLGAVDVHRLEASEALITGLTEVTDTQQGCFRFSAAPGGSRLPHPYESHTLADAPRLFTSRRFGHPAYCQLSEASPVELRTGAENGSELGAWSSLLTPIKLQSLGHKVSEYLPFGLIPFFLFET
jgi:hypothetical protein